MNELQELINKLQQVSDVEKLDILKEFKKQVELKTLLSIVVDNPEEVESELERRANVKLKEDGIYLQGYLHIFRKETDYVGNKKRNCERCSLSFKCSRTNSACDCFNNITGGYFELQDIVTLRKKLFDRKNPGQGYLELVGKYYPAEIYGMFKAQIECFGEVTELDLRKVEKILTTILIYNT